MFSQTEASARRPRSKSYARGEECKKILIILFFFFFFELLPLRLTCASCSPGAFLRSPECRMFVCRLDFCCSWSAGSFSEHWLTSHRYGLGSITEPCWRAVLFFYASFSRAFCCRDFQGWVDGHDGSYRRTCINSTIYLTIWPQVTTAFMIFSFVRFHESFLGIKLFERNFNIGFSHCLIWLNKVLIGLCKLWFFIPNDEIELKFYKSEMIQWCAKRT